VRVEYRENGDLRHELFFLEDDTDRSRFSAVVGEKEVQTVHSQEATLEQTFMKITGRGLT
jgi:fluoroquinolone transport system ATP-binding protein